MDPLKIETLIEAFSDEAKMAFSALERVIEQNRLDMSTREKAIFIGSYIMGRLAK
jgi:hypothetical protein